MRRLNLSRTLYFCLILLALFFGLFLRAYSFRTNLQFDPDFGRDSIVAWRILHGKLTLVGPVASVGGFFLGPGYFYLIAVVYAIFGWHPEAMSVVFLSMGITSIAIGFYLQSRYTSRFAATLWLLLAIPSLPLITASQSATNQPMMPLIALLFVFAYMVSYGRKFYWAILPGIITGLFFHIHFSSGLILLPFLPLFWWQTKGTLRNKIKTFACFFLAILLVISPLLIFEIRHSFIATQALLNYALNAMHGSQISSSQPHLTLFGKLSLILGMISPSQALSALGVIIGLFALIKGTKKLLSDPYLQLLSALSFGSLLLLLVYRGYVYPYYLLVPFTVWLLFLSILLSKLRPKILPLIIGTLLFGSSLLSVQYHPQYRTVANLSQVVRVVETDISNNGFNSYTLFKDSSDQMTGGAFEYRFLMMRDGFEPVSENAYELAKVMYYIQEEGNQNPLISTHYETTQFGAKNLKPLDTLQIADHTITIFRMTK